MMHIRQSRRALLAGAVAAVVGAGLFQAVIAKPKPAAQPKPAAKTPTTTVQAPAKKEVATLAAGCFWALEAMFKELKGVEKVEPGYAGGHVKNPSYEQVETATTGHAETVQVVFDPKVISYSELVEVILTARDPTTLNRQPPDDGPQYRSAIFFHSKEQQQAAQEMIKKVNAAHLWKQPIVTEVTPFSNFYRAEDYHFNYFELHPDQPYCAAVVAPEVKHFEELFKTRLKS